MALCAYYDGGDQCEANTERRFLPGWRCSRHTPAALAGRPETTPDPARTAAALRTRVLPSPDQTRYGQPSHEGDPA